MSQSGLLDVVCEQIRSCLGNIKILNHMKEYEFLAAETEHLALILSLLAAEIDTKSYLSKYDAIFLKLEKYSYLESYESQIFFLKAEEKGLVPFDDETSFFVQILLVLSNNVLRHINNGQYEKIEDEIYYNHNVPSLISSKNQKIHTDLVRHYLDIECKEYKNKCSSKMLESYELIWRKIRTKYCL